MHTHLRKVGNSRGVIIPSSFIEAWFDGYQKEASNETWDDALPDDITDEWEW